MQLTNFRRRKTSLLAQAQIAEPCNVGFENMKGDERIRFCDQCQMNVYNISQMTDGEAEALIRKADGRLCLQLYRRTDGTIITDNCPVGLRAARDRLRKLVVTFATIVGWTFLVQAVNSQGLVGAPKDVGRLGQSNEVAAEVVQVTERHGQQVLITVAIFLKAIIPMVARFKFWQKSWYWLSFLVPFCIGYEIAHLSNLDEGDLGYYPCADPSELLEPQLAGLLFGISCWLAAYIVQHLKKNETEGLHGTGKFLR